MLPLVTSTARASNVSSSLPMCILRRMRRLDPPIARQSKRGCDEKDACGHSMRLRLPFRLDAGAIDMKMQRASTAAIRQAHVQRLLKTAKSTEIRCGPVRSDQLWQALYKTSGLP